jgi:uncharacterized protein YkwD
MSRAHAGVRGGSAVAGVLLVLALLTTGLVTDQARATEEEVTPRDKMLALTNQDRTEHDRKALKLNARLSRYAARHSEDMSEKGLVHTSIKALAKKIEGLGIDWSAIGENIGVGGRLRRVQRAFMRSTDHRENILNTAYHHAATGVFEAEDGMVWVTVIFYG